MRREARDYNAKWYKKWQFSDEALSLIKAACVVSGVTRHGIRYKVDGTVASGETTTTLGNTNVVSDCIRYTIEAGGFSASAIVMGDDSACVCARSQCAALVRALRRNFKRAGLELVCRASRKRIDLEFCSGRWWACKGGYRFAPRIGRTLPKLFWAAQPNACARNPLGYARSVALGVRNLLAHLPIASATVERVLALTRGVATQPNAKFARFEAPTAGERCEKIYEQFEYVYGLTRADTLDLERIIGKVPALPWLLDDERFSRLVAADCPAVGDPPPRDPTFNRLCSGSLISALESAAPFYEEAFKHLWQPWGTLAILALEGVSYSFTGRLWDYMPTALLHVACAALPLPIAIVTHFVWNELVVGGASQSQNKVVQQPHSHRESIHQPRQPPTNALLPAMSTRALKQEKRVLKKVRKATTKLQKSKPKRKAKKARKFAKRAAAFSPMLASLNGYYQTLRAPWHFSGVRIPDPQGLPSATFKTIDRFQLAASAGSGSAAFQYQIMPPYGVDNTYTNATFPTLAANSSIYTVSDSSSTSTDLFAGFSNDPYNAADFMYNTYHYMRPVSAGVRMYYTGATLTDSGMLLATYTTLNQLAYYLDSAGGYNFNDMMTWTNTTTVVVNRHRGISCVYMPTDPSYFKYSPGYAIYSQPVTITSPYVGPNQQMYTTNVLMEPPNCYGVITLAANGLGSGSTLFVEVEVNWEGIPARNTFQAGQVSPSPSDTLALDHALTRMQSQDLAVGLGNVAYEPSIGGSAASLPGQQYPAPTTAIVRSLAAAEGGVPSAASPVAGVATPVAQPAPPAPPVTDSGAGSLLESITKFAGPLMNAASSFLGGGTTTAGAAGAEGAAGGIMDMLPELAMLAAV
jgi:hypothetical protein